MGIMQAVGGGVGKLVNGANWGKSKKFGPRLISRPNEDLSREPLLKKSETEGGR